MRINLTTPMSDDKERQRRTKAEIDAIERYTEERMADEYGRIHADIERLTNPSRLKPEEWAAFIKKAKIKKQDIAGMLCIEPETLSRILKGKACSVAIEKLFRIVMVCKLTQHDADENGQFARTLEQAVALKTICSLELKYLELVK